MKLAEIVKDYNDGLINDVQFTRQMDWQMRQEEYCQYRRDQKVAIKLADYSSAKSPEDIVIEREDAETLLVLVNLLKDALDDFDIFWAIVVEKKTQESIAKQMGISQSKVSRRFHQATEQAREYFGEIAGTLLYNDCKEMLLKRSKKEASGAKIKVRYPSEFLSNLCVGGRRGKRVWISKTVCRTLDYLDDAFGDKRTCCAYCEKCKNKEARERYGKFSCYTR